MHRCLKQLQQAEFQNYQTSRFTWNNAAQQFVHYPEGTNAALTDLDDEVLEVLNAYVIYDREKRRADVPAWQKQDPSKPSLLATLLSPEINLKQS